MAKKTRRPPAPKRTTSYVQRRIAEIRPEQPADPRDLETFRRDVEEEIADKANPPKRGSK
jgi:hypothetical protein